VLYFYSIFRHDISYNWHIVESVVKLIGQAIGSESIAKGERGVVIGRDGRLSGMPRIS
jgi:phosphomannomutase